MEKEEREPIWGESLELVGEAHEAGFKTPESIQEYVRGMHSTVLTQKSIKELLKQAKAEGAYFWSHCRTRAFDTAEGRPAQVYMG